ncbi:hypothetical protein H0H93_001392 [Arthromyces matolae]|nr:hypothetical protein H0H93_001392 [Arthromyces matolae]
MNATLTIPLTRLDQSYLEKFSVTSAHVLQSVDTDALRAALIRVIDKWRILAGYVEWSSKLSSWCLRVPLQGNVSDRLMFTTTKLAARLRPSFVVNETASAHILERPPLKYFRHDSVPHDFQSYSSSKAPIFSAHVTVLSNCACVGFTVPHGLFDGGGLGQLAHAISHELQGKSWEAPAISEFNVLKEALDDLERSPPIYDDIHEETATYAAFRRSFVPDSAPNVLKFMGGAVYRKVRHNVQIKAVFLGRKAVTKLLREVKSELNVEEKASVSTNDILAAWTFKNMHANETDDNTPWIWSYVSIRDVLSEKYPELKNYSHNGVIILPMAPFTKKELASKSLGELAVLHRKAIEPAGKVAWVQAYNTYLKKALDGHLVFTQKSGDEPWLYTNQVSARLDQINFGTKTYATWAWVTPHEFDHMIFVNKFKGGYLIQVSARATRWAALARAVQELDGPETRL